MKSLHGRRLYLDTNALVYYAEGHPEFGAVMHRLMSEFEAGRVTLATSELALAEALVLPYAIGEERLVVAYKRLLSPRPGFDIVSVDREILIASAQMRARLGCRLPDAVHAASAMRAGCEIFVSEDRRIRLPEGMRLVAISALDEPTGSDAIP